MLVLTRRNLQGIHIDVPMPDNTIKKIIVQVVGIGSSVKLGIEADKDVTILRDELVEGKKAAAVVEMKAPLKVVPILGN